MGKTSLATNIAHNVAASFRLEKDAVGDPIEAQQPVAFFSLEMSAEQLASRILSERTGVRSDAMRRGEISDDEFDRIFKATRALSQLQHFVDASPALQVRQMRTRARPLRDRK